MGKCGILAKAGKLDEVGLDKTAERVNAGYRLWRDSQTRQDADKAEEWDKAGCQIMQKNETRQMRRKRK